MESAQYDVFLAHNSIDKPAVESLARVLREQYKLEVWFDAWRLRPGLSWQKEMEEGIRGSKAGAVLVGKDGIGPWENEEMEALLQLALRQGLPVIPVLLPGVTAEPELPVFLANRHFVDLRSGRHKEAVAQLVWGITGVNPHDRPDSITTDNSQPRIDISHIIKYAPERLIGRDTETAQLDDSWQKVIAHEAGRPHVLGFVALGGEGKTSLVAKWLAGLAGRDWPGCESVFAWSFYSQGSREQVAVSSDLFLAEALKFFGDSAMASSAQGAYEKGQRLAELVGGQRSVLILDGVEPLQYPPASPTGSRLRDQGVVALLKGLAASSNGLCIVTTRFSIPDLAAFAGITYHEEELKRLSRAAGVDLLKSFGVKGSELRPASTSGNPDPLNEYEQLVEDVRGHALTLQLLGQYLKRAHRGDIRRRDGVDLARADSKIHASTGFGTGHAFRAIAAYEAWLADDSEESRRELAMLRLLGLFDRPATADCVRALREPPVISGLTDPLVSLPAEDWEFTLTALSDARLISVNRHESTGELVSLDTHPLIREYFASRLLGYRDDPAKGGLVGSQSTRDGRYPEILTNATWRAAHKRLYEHLCETTNEGDQPTLEDLQPLYQAIAHGCHAGVEQDACDNVLYSRIQRHAEYYSFRKLGAFGSGLGAVACFFDSPWTVVSPNVCESDQAWLISFATVCLRALGRLTEALDPMRASLQMVIQEEAWTRASAAVINLSDVELTLGDVSGALSDAAHGVVYADRGADLSLATATRTSHANVLHQSGGRSEAESLFREAEGMLDSPILYSVQGFWYNDLLLAPAEKRCWQRSLAISIERSDEVFDPGSELAEACRIVTERANKALALSNNLLDNALNRLMLHRAALYQSLLGCWESSDFESLDLSSQIEDAVSVLRRAGTMHYLPRGLLTRAWQRSLLGLSVDHDSAQSDLDEAWEIASRGPMPLFMADIHLHRARLFGFPRSDRCPSTNSSPPGDAIYPWESIEYDLREARRLIEKHGYGRRLDELKDAEEALLGLDAGN